MDLASQTDLRAGLRQIRHRRVALGLVLGVLPLAILAYCWGPWTSPIRTTLLLAWVAAYSLTTLSVAWSRCPRCRSLYFVAGPFFRVDPLRSSCGGCGCALSLDHAAGPTNPAEP